MMLGVTLLALLAVANANDPCFLLGGDTAKKPFPSLTQCYKQNQLACCVSAHDSTISDGYGGILSGTCVREYGDLEQFYCLGCAPDSDKYIAWYDTNQTANVQYKEYKTWNLPSGDAYTDRGDEGQTKYSSAHQQVHGKLGEIRLCQSFADRLMYSSGSEGPIVDAYDGCGMMLDGGPGGNGVLSSEHFECADDATCKKNHGFCRRGNSYCKDKNGVSTITHEHKFFSEMRPSYYGTDKFEISWYHPTGTGADGEPTCFGAASGLQVGSMAIMLIALVANFLA